MRHPTFRLAGPLAILFVGAALAAAAPASAQEERVRTVVRTGLYSLNRGHTAHLNLVDVGNRQEAAPTQVVLRLLDDRNRVVGRLAGVLRPGQPLRLAVPLPLAGNRSALVVRAEATLLTPVGNLGSSPILTFEMFNDRTLDSFTTTSCPVPYDPEGVGGRLSASCGGCQIDVEITDRSG
jgi:hypothetical protein